MDLGHDDVYKNWLGKAVSDGLVTMATIEESLARLLTIRFKLGDFDPDYLVPYKWIDARQPVGWLLIFT
jgi:hypothetical protein